MRDYFRLLVIGGTGAISHSCVIEAVAQGMRVTVLNRGRSSRLRTLPEPVESLTADITDPPSVEAALGDIAEKLERHMPCRRRRPSPRWIGDRKILQRVANGVAHGVIEVDSDEEAHPLK